MSYCISSDASGNQCANTPLAGEFTCADHAWVNPNPPMMPACEYHGCSTAAVWGKSLCTFHIDNQRRVALDLLAEAKALVRDKSFVVHARDLLKEANERGQLVGEIYHETVGLLEQDIMEWRAVGLQLAVPVPLCTYREPYYACLNPAEDGTHMCAYHGDISRPAAQALLREASGFLWNDNDPAAARRFLESAVVDGRLVARLSAEMIAALEEDIVLWAERRGLDGAARGELHEFVLDNQNVHTEVVAQQMQAGEQILLNTLVPVGQKTLAEIAAQWHEKRDAEFSDVMRDMHHWYAVTFCRDEGDRLYARVLDGLWALIKRSPHKADLTERLWDEAFDSVEMCCDGHIARLCNVMVGFDDAFKTPLSNGELLQQKMAAIAAKDISLGEKVTEAWPVFEDLGVPIKERRAWIDAF